MHIATLAQTPLETVRSAFELAFGDYELPVKISIESLREMMVTRDLALERSFGCFDDGTLVGFILCGYREDAVGPILYDGGTGVVPSHRGRHIANELLGTVLEHARSTGVGRFLLEVLQHNEKARELYREAGFEATRFLRCFRTEKAQLHAIAIQRCCSFEPLDKPAFANLDHPSFLPFAPSWQNDVRSVTNVWDRHACLSIIKDGRLAGYGVIHREKGNIPLLAIPDGPQTTQMYDALIHALSRLTEAERLTILNVADGALLTRHLKSNGWVNFVNQYEMCYQMQ